MPKVTKWVIVFILMFTLISNTSIADAETQSVTVESKSLNIRSGPGLTYEVLGSMKKGDRVTVLATSGEWLQINVGNDTGWIAAWLTKSEGETAASTIVSRVDSLNVRANPSTGSAILGRMNAGDEATMTSRDGSWAQVVVDGKNGWVHTDYISETSGQTGQIAEVSSDITVDAFTVAVDALNVRKSADLSSKRVGLIHKDESYEIKKRDGNWILISIDKGKEGWVYSFHGTVSSAMPASPKDAPTSNTVTILSDGTSIRESATTASQVVTRANAGERFTITSEAGEWYEIVLPSGETAFVANWVVSANEGETNGQQEKPKNKARVPGTLEGLTIVIDPGHGGNDHGTTGARGTDEKNITLLTSELLASKLKAAGANVLLTRETDAYVSLRKRVALSHQYEADAFISVHYDATTSSSVSGFTTYYTHERQKMLAAAVNDGLDASIAIRNRGAQPGDFLVLRENRQNAILIELGFLSNPTEERTLTTEIFREQATLGIYNGLLAYFNSN